MASSYDELPIGTICGEGYPYRAFLGRQSDVPDGWVICMGQTLGPTEHGFGGRDTVRVPDLRSTIRGGVSTHLVSGSYEDGAQGAVRADNEDVPGLYPIMKVR